MLGFDFFEMLNGCRLSRPSPPNQKAPGISLVRNNFVDAGLNESVSGQRIGLGLLAPKRESRFQSRFGCHHRSSEG
jgi:hypothetical protein